MDLSRSWTFCRPMVMLLISSRLRLIGLGLLLSSGWAQAQSLTAFVRQALATYPALTAAQAHTQAANADIVRARSAHHPQISLEAGLNRFATGAVPTSLGSSSLLPSVRVNLWSGGRIEADTERAQALAQASQAQQRLTRDDVALQACEAYLSWLKQADLLALAEHNLQTHQQTLEDIRQIAQVDTGRRLDLEQAQVRVDNARLTQQSRQAELAVAQYKLQRFGGPEHPTRSSAMLSDSPLSPVPTSAAEALSELREDLPTLAQWLAQVRAAQAALRLARGARWPNLDGLASRQFNTNTQRFDTLMQVQLTMPLYNGQATQAQVDAAQAQLQQAEANLREARLQQHEKIAQAWQEWASTRQRAEVGTTQSDVAQTLVAGYRQQFRLGRRSLLDLLNVQADSFNYRQAALSAWHDERIGRARLLAATGELAQRFEPNESSPQP